MLDLGPGVTMPIVFNFEGTFLHPVTRTAKRSAVRVLHHISRRMLDTAIVESGSTREVDAHLETLLASRSVDHLYWLARTFGNSQKAVMSEDRSRRIHWDVDLHARVQFEGAPAQTLLQRPHYLRRLRLLRAMFAEESGRSIDWPHIVVFSDDFETDLALPLMLGSHIGLVLNDHTPNWQRQLVGTHTRARVITDLIEVLPYYDEVQASL